MITHRKKEHVSKCRLEKEIRADIWAKLWREDSIRHLDIYNIDIELHEGIVVLLGHVAKLYHQRRIQDLVEEVPGVYAVRNELIADRDLEIEVAQALVNNPLTRAPIIRVGASHGWIHLHGDVPSPQVCAAAEEIAASVQWVRGVVTLPRIAGEPYGQLNRRLQPKLGAKVYASDGQVGKVSQVVFSPRNRLVTHIAVDARFDLNGPPVTKEFVIQAETIKHAKGSSVFLANSLREVAEYPAFEQEEHPTAPPSWRPPFPYTKGNVRWSHQLACIPWTSVVGVPMPMDLIQHKG